MRRLFAVVCAVLLTTGLAACGSSTTTSASASCAPTISKDQLVTPGALTYATNATLPPMQYVQGDKVVGMRIDMAAELAKRLCLRPVSINVPFDSQIPGVQGHRWDMINTGLFYTPARADTLNLVPYEVQGVAVSVAKGNPKGITSSDGLSGRTVAVEAPGYEFDTLTALNKTFQGQGRKPIVVRTFQTNADAFQALSAGQADGVAIVEAVTTYYQQGGRFETAVRGMNTAPLALGMAKDRKALADAVATAMAAMKSSGWLDSLFKKYGVTPFDGSIAVSTGALQTGQ
jgi:polar amino acid transport system substrate-binding protein